MLWIGRFFNISYVYFLISVFVLSTLNNTVMGTFRNNPIKENVVFLMGKIEIIKRAKETDKVTVVQTSSEPVNLEIVKYMIDHTRILVISL